MSVTFHADLLLLTGTVTPISVTEMNKCTVCYFLVKTITENNKIYNDKYHGQYDSGCII